MYWVFSCFQRIIVLNPKDGITAESADDRVEFTIRIPAEDGFCFTGQDG